MAPEVFLLDLQLLAEEGTTKRRTLSTSDATEMVNPSSPPNVDTWSLGVVLLQYLAVCVPYIYSVLCSFILCSVSIYCVV